MIAFESISIDGGRSLLVDQRRFRILTTIMASPGIRLGSLIPDGSVVTERWLSEMEKNGIVEFRDDTAERPLAGPNVYLTVHGERAISAAIDRRKAASAENKRMIAHHRSDAPFGTVPSSK